MANKIRENQYWLDRNPETIYKYWETLNHPHRKLILDILQKKFPRLKSLLEVGCGCGPNLKNISIKFPQVNLAGIDINKYAIFKAREHLTYPENFQKDATLVIAPSYQIPFNDKTFDIILTDAVLMYLSINKVKQTIEEFKRVAKKGLILIELNGKSKIGELQNGYWCRDYKSLLESYGFKVVKQKIPKEIWSEPIWEAKGFVYIARHL